MEPLRTARWAPAAPRAVNTAAGGSGTLVVRPSTSGGHLTRVEFMRALFGVVSLLVVLAIVGLIVVKQLKAVGRVGAQPPSADATGVPLAPAMSGSGNVREQAAQLQNQVADDVAKALNQGAAAGRVDTEK